MNLKSCVFLLGLLFIFSACSKDDSPDPKPVIPKIDYSNLEVGQQTAYIRYESICGNMDDAFNYLPDTVITEVIAVEGNEYTFSEYYTPNSQSYLNGNVTPTEYPVIYENDYILIPERSSSVIFWFYGNDTLQLRPNNLIDLEQEGCVLSSESGIFIGNDIGKIKEYVIGGVSMKDLTAVSCVPGWIGPLDAYLIYNENGLITSHTSQGSGSDSPINGFMEVGRN